LPLPLPRIIPNDVAAWMTQHNDQFGVEVATLAGNVDILDVFKRKF
jgi:hypothetical protein